VVLRRMPAKVDRAGRDRSFGTARTTFTVPLGAADRTLRCMPAEADLEVNQDNNVEFGGVVGDGVGSNGASSCVFSPAFITAQHLR